MDNRARIEALTAAKVAVRAYAKDPTAGNAADVEAAWRAIRKIDALSSWRRMERVKRHVEAVKRAGPSSGR